MPLGEKFYREKQYEIFRRYMEKSLSSLKISIKSGMGSGMMAGGGGIVDSVALPLAITAGVLSLTGLSTIGTANYIPGVNAAANAWEYKHLIEGANITITHAAGSITIAAAAGGAPHNLFSAIHSDTVAAAPILGDIPYGDATPNWTKLAGNTIATKKFLTQTGAGGGVSAVPGWTTIIASDLPSINLDDLADVNAPAPNDQDVLTWDDGTSKWISQAPPAGGAIALDDLTDVNAPAPNDQDILTWDDGAGEWIAQAVPAGGALALDDLTDVNAPAPADNDSLTWDAGTSKWIPEAVAGGGASWFPLFTSKKWFMSVPDTVSIRSTNYAHANSYFNVNANDPVTSWLRGLASYAGDYAYIAGTGYYLVRRAHNPTFICVVKTTSTITKMRVWAGLTDAFSASAWDDDSPLFRKLIAFRFSADTSANWYYCTKDGATLNAVDSGLVYAASTIYVLKFVVNSGAGTVTFTINGGSQQVLNANLPATTVELGCLGIYIVADENVAKSIDWAGHYVEFNQGA